MNGKRSWVLVVDDEPEICELVEDCLKHHFGNKIKVIVAKDGLDATRRLPFQAFDCIITDLNMPKKEGKAFIRTARSSQLNEFTPIIVISGDPNPDLEKQDYIYSMAKPLDFDALADLVGNQIKLGKIDKRLNANVVNGMVEAINSFYETVMKQECKVVKPAGKMSGRSLEGEFFRLHELSLGATDAKFVFSMDKELLFNIQDKMSLTECKDLKDVVEIFVRKIYKIAMSELNVVRIKETQSYSSPEETSHLDLSKGIVVPFESEFGKLYFYSLW